jgi:hypothetical protein
MLRTVVGNSSVVTGKRQKSVTLLDPRGGFISQLLYCAGQCSPTVAKASESSHLIAMQHN